MWKRNIFSFSTVFAALILAASAPAYPKTRAIFIYEGETKHESVTIELSRRAYVSFNDVAKVYNLSLSFRPVSGKVTISGFNRRAEFVINSDRYQLTGVSKRMKFPVRSSGDRAYLPLDFILSGDFSDFTETETLYYPETATFVITVKHNVYPARFYSRPDGTKIIIGTKEPLPVSKKYSGGKFAVEFTRGKVIEESLSPDDGVVREIRQSNKGRTASVEIFLTENAKEPAMSENDNVVEIFVPRAPAFAAAPTDELQLPVSTAPVPSQSLATSTDAVSANYPAGEVGFEPSPAAAVVAPPVAAPSVKRADSKAAARLTVPKIKIVLDAGHGGEDPGAVGPNGFLEKDVNLAIVNELESIFSKDDGIETILTRRDDTFIPLVDRTNLANERSADIFVSVHCNASMKKSTGGYEVYFLSETASDPEAMATQILENSVVELEKKSDKKRTKLQELLWSMIVNEFINESAELCQMTTQEIPKRIKVANRGVRQAGFFVLRGAQMPAILVECAFLSNPAEEAKLRDPRAQRQIADGLYMAVKNYLRRKGRIED